MLNTSMAITNNSSMAALRRRILRPDGWPEDAYRFALTLAGRVGGGTEECGR
jgi:hypothetical protein